MSSVKEIQKRFREGCEKRFRDTYGMLKRKKVWIYGSGMYGRFLAKALVHYGCVMKGDIQAFINDFESTVEEVDGIPVCKLNECHFLSPSYNTEYCVVVAMQNNREVVQRLRAMKIEFFCNSRDGLCGVDVPLMFYFGRPDLLGGSMEKRIERFYELKLPENEMAGFYSDQESLAVLKNRLESYKTGCCELLTSCPLTRPEYFNSTLLSIGKNEVYVDCGAYTGDSVLDFVTFTGRQYEKIHAFEPDPRTFAKLSATVDGLPNVETHNVATGNQNGSIMFSDGHDVGSFISKEGKIRVPVVRLDDCLQDVPTLVKMDIEGAELDALRGMSRILREHRPKLAICVYHKVEDLYEIPKYLKETVPEYRLKLRQHDAGFWETVLYAEVCGEKD